DSLLKGICIQLLQTALHRPELLVLLRQPSSNGKMKLSAVVLALLIASFCSRASSAPAQLPQPNLHSCCLSLPLPVGPDVPTCCTTYITHKIPRNLIRKHYSTSTSCSKPAIIFITKKEREVCANPSDPWVQSYLQSAKRD
ncbi:hypothetical protein CIB84_003142, partial [Bambusicola thoracicus]